jgi:hypothetical protein
MFNDKGQPAEINDLVNENLSLIHFLKFSKEAA